MDTQEKQEVSELLAKSAYALDHKDVDTLMGCFTADASFTLVIDGVEEASVFLGQEEIRGLMQGALDVQTDLRRHVISNLFFTDVQGDQATATTYLTLNATENGLTRLITTGLYTDKVSKSDDGWKIKDRHLKLDRPY